MDFFISKDEPLTREIIKTIVAQFDGMNKPILQKYQNYYEGNQDILKKHYSDPTKPCNKLIKNYAYSITNNYLGYIVGIPVAYQSEKDISELMDVFNYNDIENTDSTLLKNALIYGVAYETYWIDEEGKERFKVVDSKECIPVYDDTLNQDLLYVIRYYVKPSWDNSKQKQYIIEVYNDTTITRYLADAFFGITSQLDETSHFFGQVPFTEFKLNDEKLSIFDQIITLQDGYNELISSEVDDYQAFVDAYLCLYGVGIDEDDVPKMRENRLLQMNADDRAEYLTKEVNDAQIQNMLDNLDTAIHQISNSPDFTDQEFGASSGVALRYKLIGFENTSAGIVANMKKAIQKRIELISTIISIKNAEEIWRDIQIIFKRNIPEDTSDEMATINNLRGLVSDETLLGQLRFIDDPKLELQKRLDEQTASMDLINFSSGMKEEEEEDEEE